MGINTLKRKVIDTFDIICCKYIYICKNNRPIISILMRKSFLLLFLALFIPIFVYSQAENVKTLMKGRVLESSNKETIPYATIRISSKLQPEKVLIAVPTDDKGKFQFNIDKIGEYSMDIQFVGKIPAKQDFTVSESKTIDLGDILMDDDDKVLNEVVVTSQKPLVKVDLDKITYSIEDDPESTTKNALDMMKKVPMITVDGEENIQLKGSGSYKIYLNGKPSNMISSNPKDVLKSMPASTIKDIEVITDPGAKYDAEGLAGIINIITQKQTSMGGYTATINTNVDDRGSYGLGGYLTTKVGKFGFTGNYNYYDYRRPRGNSNSYNEDFKSTANKYLLQNGSRKNKGNGQYGSGEISYEIDTLNLVNIGFSRYHGSGESNSTSLTEMRKANEDLAYSYKNNTKSDYTYGSTDLTADYQRTFSKVKDRLLTASYRWSSSPDDWSSYNERYETMNIANNTNSQYSDGKMNEHTFQLDFTTPIAKIHTVETGIKYIIRLNESTSGYQFLNSNNLWESVDSPNDRFKHDQDIVSGYLGYNLKLKKWGFKTGLRYEYTDLNVKYTLDHERDFGTDYSNLVPSATVTYQIKETQNIRLGYNMRIMRPGIWELNPFVNSTDTNNIRVGNPNLEAVKSHTINTNYSFFQPKININASMSYNFVNNSVQDISTINDGIKTTTYENIGKSKSVDINTYINWTPNSKFRFTTNLSGSYSDIKANNDQNFSNHGFMGRFYTNIQYTLPKSYRVNVSGGAGSGYIGLQNKGSSYNFHGVSLAKGFLNDRLNFNFYVSNPLTHEQTYKQKQNTMDYYSVSENVYKSRSFNLSVSFRFGEMKAQIKKAARSISNDDSMGGGSGGSQGGGQQTGN